MPLFQARHYIQNPHLRIRCFSKSNCVAGDGFARLGKIGRKEDASKRNCRAHSDALDSQIGAFPESAQWPIGLTNKVAATNVARPNLVMVFIRIQLGNPRPISSSAAFTRALADSFRGLADLRMRRRTHCWGFAPKPYCFEQVQPNRHCGTPIALKQA